MFSFSTIPVRRRRHRRMRRTMSRYCPTCRRIHRCSSLVYWRVHSSTRHLSPLRHMSAQVVCGTPSCALCIRRPRSGTWPPGSRGWLTGTSKVRNSQLSRSSSPSPCVAVPIPDRDRAARIAEPAGLAAAPATATALINRRTTGLLPTLRIPRDPERISSVAQLRKRDRAMKINRGQDPGRAAGDAPVRAMDRVRAAGERLRLVARQAALARLAQVPPRREADIHRQPAGRPPGLPARRARRDGQQLRRKPDPPDQAHSQKRAVRRPRRGCACMGPYRQPHRDLQDERGRALRLAQDHARKDCRRLSQQPHRRTPPLELQAPRQAESRVPPPHRLRSAFSRARTTSTSFTVRAGRNA